jgi:hypothetical protein
MEPLGLASVFQFAGLKLPRQTCMTVLNLDPDWGGESYGQALIVGDKAAGRLQAIGDGLFIGL